MPRELKNLHISSETLAAALAAVTGKRQHGPRSGGRISGERVPADDCRLQHALFSKSKCKCLYWRRDWGDVPKAITEASAAGASKSKN